MSATDILCEYANAIRGNWNIDGRTVKADLDYLVSYMTARELTDKEARELRLCSNICPKGYGFWTGEGYDCDHCDDKECPSSEWRKLAEGGVVPESCIRIEEEGSICPAPKVNVTFEGQKLTFDAAESKEFLQLVSAHFRRLAGIEVPS